MNRDERDDPRPKRLIYEMREQVQAVRNDYWQESCLGQVSERTRLKLAAVAVQYYDVLYEHREESVLGDDAWNNTGADRLRELLGETVEVDAPAPGDSANPQRERKPAILTIDPEAIVNVTKRLDEISKKLGFSATVGEKTADEEEAIV